MNRRNFIKLAGSMGASSLMVHDGVLANARRPQTGSSSQMPIQTDQLQHRNQNRSTLVCQNGMVCSSQPLASLAGIEILKAGGNAVDAAICANAVLSVVEPMACGPGGDLFAIVWREREKKLYGLNASGRAPFDWSIAEAEKLGLKEIPTFGPLSWSVPGCVSGWHALTQKFGSQSPPQLLDPAIRYAAEGFPVSPVVARDWQFQPDKDYPTLAETFAPNGKTPGFGDMFYNTDMAAFFKILARDGFAAFYDGEIAERIVRFSQSNGGRFAIRDFREHEANWVEPVSTDYRGYDVWELPPNGQGIAALQIMNLLEHFDIAALQPNCAEQLHLLIEAKKLAFEDRAVYYADMDFARVPVAELISKSYAAERVKLIDPGKAAQQVAAGRLSAPSDTTYLCAADNEGNMISLIQSIFHGFASRMVPDRLGFVLQNRGKLFSLDSRHLNKLEPQKRPFHTIIPAFLTQNGQPVFAFGVMGGDFQPQGHAQILMNIIDFGMSPQQAGEQPRVAHFESSTPIGQRMIAGGQVGFERGFPESSKTQLANMGHEIREQGGAFGGYQGIWRKQAPMRYFGGSDPRKDGCAIGY
jgi:gamma-glutamyltranspeptidase/glutathione hydrolase